MTAVPDADLRQARLIRRIEYAKRSAAEAMGEAVQDYLDRERLYAAGMGDFARATVLEDAQKGLKGIIESVCWEVTCDAWMDVVGEDDGEVG